jgi:hypothetical protein
MTFPYSRWSAWLGDHRSKRHHRYALLFALAFAASSMVAVCARADAVRSANEIRNASIAARFSDAFKRGVVLPREFLADYVEVRHLPPLPGDPEVIKKEALGVNDRAALIKILKDFRLEVIATASNAEGFTIDLILSGVRRSGKKFVSSMSLHFAVVNGLVTGFEAAQDPAERAQLEELEKEGALRSPSSVAPVKRPNDSD